MQAIRKNIWKVAAVPLVLAGSKQKEVVKPTLVRPSELPLYEEEDESRFEYHVEGPSQLQEGIAVVTKEVRSICAQTKEYTDSLCHIYETGKAHTMTSVDYILDEENIAARAGVIAGGGLLGLMLRPKNSGIIRKLLYTGAGAGATSAALYPSTAYQLSAVGYKEAQDYANIGYNFIVGMKPADEKKDSIEPPVSSSKPALEKPSPVKTEEKPKTAKEEPKKALAPKIAGDYGQSNPADKDMYTTRS